jgi:hypothetical protein
MLGPDGKLGGDEGGRRYSARRHPFLQLLNRFKDDGNGFVSISDVCFMTIHGGSVQCACVSKYCQAGHDQIGRPIGYLCKGFVVCKHGSQISTIYNFPICVNHTMKQ